MAPRGVFLSPPTTTTPGAGRVGAPPVAPGTAAPLPRVNLGVRTWSKWDDTCIEAGELVLAHQGTSCIDCKTSCYVMSCVILFDVVVCYVMSCHVMSSYVMLCYIILYHVMFRYVMLCCVM